MIMNSELTEKQQSVLRFLQEEYQTRGRMPSYAEVARAMDVSTTAAYAHVVALERKGWVRRSRRARAIQLLRRPMTAPPSPPGLVRLPIIGRIAAGQPIEASQDLEEYLTVEAGLARGEDCYVLRVQGYSMVGDGIHDGDLVIVHPQGVADNGDTVVALLEGNAATLKRYYREKDYVRLQPANPYLEPMFVRDLTIQGKVVSLVRLFQ